MDVPARATAIALGPPPTVAAELAGHFTDVLELRSLEETTLPEATVDCIAAMSPDFLVGHRDIDAVLQHCRRLLRPRGVLAIAYRNSRRHAFSRRPPALRKVPTRLRQAGFSTVTTFFLQPDVSTPRHIIPDTRSAMLAHERGAGPSVAARRVLARARAGSLLYPGVLAIAHA